MTHSYLAAMRVMQDQDLRRAFGARIKELRKQQGWTQKELALKLDMQFSHLNKYEGGLHAPPLEKLVQLAEVFNTSVDFLITGQRSEDIPVHDRRLLDRLQALEAFKAEDQETVIRLLDAMIIKQRVESALAPVGR